MSKNCKFGCLRPISSFIFIIFIIFIISTCSRNNERDESLIKSAAVVSKPWYDYIKSIWASEVLSVYNAKDSINNE